MFFDIGIGILLAIFGTSVLGLSWNGLFISMCIVFALVPDIDMLSLASKKLDRFFGGHRGWMHYPVIHILPLILIGLLFGWQWGILFGLGVFIHLIHDTFWIGSGIKWLWPYSKKSYTYFSQEYVVKPGDGWIRAFYFRWNRVTIIEWGVFVAAVIIALYFSFTSMR
jgi:hypothetical protein